MINNCPICHSRNVSQFWKDVWGDPKLHVMRCANCELFFLDKSRGQDGQKDFDQNYDKYISIRATAVASAGAETAFEEMVDDSITERFRDISRYFEGAGSVLEVGAERGGFLDRLKGKIGRITAVDSCPEYHDTLRSKGYTAYSYIDDVPTSDKYDRICLFSLLEHIPEPVAFMKALAGRLAPNGKIIIEAPSAAEPLVSLYDIPAYKSFYFQAMHPYVYSLKALEILLADSGLKKVSVQHKQRYGLGNHLQWLKAGIPGGNPEYARLFDGKADEAYRLALEASGRTDTLYLVASLP